MNRLRTDQRTRVIGCLVEGMSIRAIVRITGVAKNTVVKLLVDLGKVCSEYLARKDHTNLNCKRIHLLPGEGHDAVNELEGPWPDRDELDRIFATFHQRPRVRNFM